MTCLCLTRNRRQWLPIAIQCFIDQTYPYRELLIIADGVDVRDLIPDDDRIQLHHVDRAAEIGEKRNFGCSLATGEIIAHWDDDDFSAPGRLDDQIRRLGESGKAVTGYRSMRFTDGSRSWQFLGAPEYAIGTSLCYRRDFWRSHKFPAVQTGEDKTFVIEAWNAGQLEPADDLGLMHATIHPGNTSPRSLEGRSWRALG